MFYYPPVIYYFQIHYSKAITTPLPIHYSYIVSTLNLFHAYFVQILSFGFHYLSSAQIDVFSTGEVVDVTMSVTKDNLEIND